MKILNLVLISILTMSCSTNTQRSQDSSKSCEDLLLKSTEDYKVVKVTEQASGYAISYAVTGAAYLTEFTYNIAVVGGAMIIQCSPALALSALAGGAPMPAGPCIGDPPKTADFGEKAYKKTKNLRCPNMDSLSANFRNAAQCFYSKSDGNGKTKAKEIINAITDADSFYGCLSKDEKEKVLKLKGEVTGLW